MRYDYMPVHNNMLGTSYLMVRTQNKFTKIFKRYTLSENKKKLIFHCIHTFNIYVACNIRVEIFSNEIDRK